MASGNIVTANVGGNLDLQSVQDTSKESSAGVSEPPRLSRRPAGVSHDDAARSHIDNARTTQPPCKLVAMRCASRHIATRCATTSDSGDASVQGTLSSAR